MTRSRNRNPRPPPCPPDPYHASRTPAMVATMRIPAFCSVASLVGCKEQQYM